MATKRLSEAATARATDLRKAKSGALYLMYCAQEVLEARSGTLESKRRHAESSLLLGQTRAVEDRNASTSSNDLGAAGPSNSCGPEVVRAQERVEELRMLLTNREAEITQDAVAARVSAAKDAMELAGLKGELMLRMKREKPSKFELVNQVLPGLFVGGCKSDATFFSFFFSHAPLRHLPQSPLDLFPNL